MFVIRVLNGGAAGGRTGAAKKKNCTRARGTKNDSNIKTNMQKKNQTNKNEMIFLNLIFVPLNKKKEQANHFTCIFVIYTIIIRCEFGGKTVFMFLNV